MEKVKERDGFSLMEMIIVIAILGMITGGIAVTYNMVRSADVKGMAYDIDSSLTNLKSKNMGSNKQLFMHLYKQSGNYFIDYTEEESYTPSGEGESVGESGESKLDSSIFVEELAMVTKGGLSRLAQAAHIPFRRG